AACTGWSRPSTAIPPPPRSPATPATADRPSRRIRPRNETGGAGLRDLGCVDALRLLLRQPELHVARLRDSHRVRTCAPLRPPRWLPLARAHAVPVLACRQHGGAPRQLLVDASRLLRRGRCPRRGSHAGIRSHSAARWLPRRFPSRTIHLCYQVS